MPQREQKNRVTRAAKATKPADPWAKVEVRTATRKSLQKIAADASKSTARVVALFAGQNHASKVAAAEALADQASRPLLQVDLSAVVSKYIGETEKNLRRIFDQAGAKNAILFFDEADALFGKRSKVMDSQDGYANIDINFLLQRLEAFDGVALIATNCVPHLDPACKRRFAYVVRFPRPPAK
jgi:SpoVK/Ycf46/Vps4 family AAA+-type ATPase